MNLADAPAGWRSIPRYAARDSIARALESISSRSALRRRERSAVDRCRAAIRLATVRVVPSEFGSDDTALSLEYASTNCFACQHRYARVPALAPDAAHRHDRPRPDLHAQLLKEGDGAGVTAQGKGSVSRAETVGFVTVDRVCQLTERKTAACDPGGAVRTVKRPTTCFRCGERMMVIVTFLTLTGL